MVSEQEMYGTVIAESKGPLSVPLLKSTQNLSWCLSRNFMNGPQTGTVQAVGYIGARSPTEGHR